MRLPKRRQITTITFGYILVHQLFHDYFAKLGYAQRYAA
jgi:hypothetical protein